MPALRTLLRVLRVPTIGLPVLGLALFAATGCEDDAYYQARYIPTTSDTTVFERIGYDGDPTAFELPAAPPDLEGTHPARIDCTVPGPRVTPDPFVGLAPDQIHDRDHPDRLSLVDTDRRDHGLGPLTTIPGPALSGTTDLPYQPGLPDRPGIFQVGGPDRRPQVTTGSTASHSPPINLSRTRDTGNQYCCGHGATVNSPPSLPSASPE